MITLKIILDFVETERKNRKEHVLVNISTVDHLLKKKKINFDFLLLEGILGRKLLSTMFEQALLRGR